MVSAHMIARTIAACVSVAMGSVGAGAVSLTEIAVLLPQQCGAPVAIAGEQLVWKHGQRADLWNLTTGTRASRVRVDEPSVALGVAGRAIVLVAQDSENRSARLLRFEDFRVESILADPAYSFAGADRVVDAGRNEIWVSELPHGAARYRVGERVERLGTLSWPMSQWVTFSAAAESARAHYYESGSIVRIGPANAREEFAVSVEIANPWHLAGGPRPGTVWATSRDTLFLVELDRRKARVLSRMRPGGEIYHLSAAGDLAVLLTVTMEVGAWKSVTLVALAPSGEVRWRRVLQVPERQEGWVAASADYVAVVLGQTLYVYSARESAPVLETIDID
jgi:hypothetical protein